MRVTPSQNHGNILIVAVCTTGLIGFALASYLALTASQANATMRSQSWNMCIPVAEAGIEEALSHLYYHGDGNRAADGWVAHDGRFTKQRGGQGDDYYYVVHISSDANATVTSRGFVQLPNRSGYVARNVRITTVRDSMFAKALVAKGQIDLNGNNVRTDSFDSGDPNYSTDGKYNSAKSKDGGDVASNASVINTVNVGNANIRGRVSTGPGGTVAIGPNGAVGSKAWHDAGRTGIEPGWSSDDMNVSFPDVQPPFSGGAFTPGSGRYGGTNYTYLLLGGNYLMSSLSMSGQQQMLVTNRTILWVTGNVSLSGQAQIIIATNSSLDLYVGTSSGSPVSASLGGNGIANNSIGNATNFFYHGLPSNTSVSFSGNAAFTGVIYAPNAALALGGGGNNTYDFVGASVSATATLNGHFNFHYDEALGRIGPRRGYVITSWNEVAWNED
jgi:hypothetical protein